MTFTYLWLGWLIAFMVIEAVALWKVGTQATLSAHVWRWGSVRVKGKAWRWRRLLLLAFMVWLLVHFITGGWV